MAIRFTDSDGDVIEVYQDGASVMFDPADGTPVRLTEGAVRRLQDALEEFLNRDTDENETDYEGDLDIND